MPRTFIFLLIGLFFGTGLGFLLAAGSGAQLTGHDHGPGGHDEQAASDMVHDHSAHDHGQGGHDHDRLVEVEGPAPALSLVIHPDGRQSRNLEIRVENFIFDPEHVGGPHVPGRGHAHVYVDGVKIARTYCPWFHLAALPVGTHEVRVTLNANDHGQLAVAGKPIEAVMPLVIE